VLQEVSQRLLATPDPVPWQGTRDDFVLADMPGFLRRRAASICTKVNRREGARPSFLRPKGKSKSRLRELSDVTGWQSRRYGHLTCGDIGPRPRHGLRNAPEATMISSSRGSQAAERHPTREIPCNPRFVIQNACDDATTCGDRIKATSLTEPFLLKTHDVGWKRCTSTSKCSIQTRKQRDCLGLRFLVDLLAPGQPQYRHYWYAPTKLHAI
jgi:hypothetical protein